MTHCSSTATNTAMMVMVIAYTSAFLAAILSIIYMTRRVAASFRRTVYSGIRGSGSTPFQMSLAEQRLLAYVPILCHILQSR